MDAKFKAEWLKALRSGEFDQCHDELTDGIGGFCCIGVGYQVLGHNSDEIAGDDDPTYLAADALGLPNDIRDELIKLNDGQSGARKHSFPEIADYIEANL